MEHRTCSYACSGKRRHKIYKNLTNLSKYLNGQGQSCSKIMFRTHVLEHDRTYVPKNHVLEHKLEHITVQKFAEKRPKTKKIEYAYDKIDRTAVAGV